MPKQHIKTGMEVKILAGKDRGKTGKVLQVFPKLHRVVVEGMSLAKRHLRTRRNGEAGRVVEFSMPIHISNVQPIDAAVSVAKVAEKTVEKKSKSKPSDNTAS